MRQVFIAITRVWCRKSFPFLFEMTIKGFKNIYQELMKRVEKKEDTVVFFVGLSMIYWAISDDFHAKN